MITTNQIIEWVRNKIDPTLGVVEEDYGFECVQRLREWEEIRTALLKIVEGIEEIESIYLEKE